MKKIKTLLLSLAIGFTVAAATTAVACNKNEGAATSSDWFAGEDENLVSLAFAAPSVNVNQYESVALTCTVKGTSSAVQYTSSDTTIATVDSNGVVSAKAAMGKVTITAEVEGISATCEVNVVESPYAPELILNQSEYVIENGTTLPFTVETEWNQIVLDEAIEYSATLAEDSQNAASTVSVDGNVITVEAKAIETINVVVSATVRGIYTSKIVTVSVVAPTIKIKTASADFTPNNGYFSTSVSTTDLLGDMENSLPLNFVVSKGAETLETPITWTSDSESVVIEGNNLVGKMRGTATLTGTVNYEGEEATVQVVCDVIPPQAHLEQTATLEIEDLKTLKLDEPLLEGDKIINVELFGKQISSRAIRTSIQFSKDNFPKEAKRLGAQQIVINTNLVTYTMDVEIFTMIINTKEEFDRMRIVADTGDMSWNDRYQVWKPSQFYDGYFVLGNDIEYNGTITNMTDTGSVWWATGSSGDFSRGFKGIFDGRGYNVNGLTVGSNPSGSNKEAGGLFGYISVEGVVKNVSFTNAGLLANCGFIASMGEGTIENVSVSYKTLGGNAETNGINSANPTKMGTFFSYKAGSSATVRNCLVDASAANIVFEHGTYQGAKTNNVNLIGVAQNVENVIAICPNEEVLKNSGADIQVHTYDELMRDTSVFKKFDSSIWTVTEQGVPMFVNQANTLDVDRAVNFLDSVEETLVSGFELVILTDNPYVKIEVEEMEGVTYKDGILTATDAAFRQTVTLTATSLFNPEITATHKVYIDSFGKSVAKPAISGTPVLYCNNPVLTLGDNSWMGEENYLYLGAQVVGSGSTELVVDGWQNLEWGTNEVTVVSVKNGERENFTTTLKLDYVRGDFAQAELIADSAFSVTRYNGEYTLTDVTPADVEAPEGYENVQQLNSTVEWSTALSKEFFSSIDPSEYQDIWFSLKVVNGRWIMQTVTLQTDAWVDFHLTQTSDGVWAIEVTHADGVYTTQYDISGTKIRDLIYRAGWANGFLLYNNNTGTVTEDTPTSVYATEMVGIKKAN